MNKPRDFIRVVNVRTVTVKPGLHKVETLLRRIQVGRVLREVKELAAYTIMPH